MQVVIFYGYVERKKESEALQDRINSFLRGLPSSDVMKVQAVPCQQGHCAVFVWLKADAKEATG